MAKTEPKNYKPLNKNKENKTNGRNRYSNTALGKALAPGTRIEEALAERIRYLLATEGAPAAYSLLKEAVTSKDDAKWPPKLRLEAAKTLLDRAGFIAPKAPEAPGGAKPLQQMDQGELAEQLRRVQAELSNRATVIVDAPNKAGASPQDTDLAG